MEHGTEVCVKFMLQIYFCFICKISVIIAFGKTPMYFATKVVECKENFTETFNLSGNKNVN